jgi:hypothetical protein
VRGRLRTKRHHHPRVIPRSPDLIGTTPRRPKALGRRTKGCGRSWRTARYGPPPVASAEGGPQAGEGVGCAPDGVFSTVADHAKKDSTNPPFPVPYPVSPVPFSLLFIPYSLFFAPPPRTMPANRIHALPTYRQVATRGPFSTAAGHFLGASTRLKT